MNGKKLRGVIGIVERDGKYLFGLESKDSPIKGKWRLLGGKLEGYENAEQAMIRECREEAGIEVRVNGFLGNANGTLRDIAIDVCYGQYISGNLNPKLDEISEAGWFTFDETLLMDIESLSRCMFYIYLERFTDN